ncbi:Sorting nexin-16 [Bienertia sinuspersici]
MVRRMETIQDLIDEAKIRFLWWAIFIFSITYFLSHTSKSMWMNIPVAVLIAIGLRHLTNEVEFHMKVPSTSKRTYLSHLEKKQLSVNDSRLFTAPLPPKWRRKFDFPIVEAAVEEFVDKIIEDFVTDLWYSDITPDKEAPELMRAIILEALGEVAGRVKEVNLVDLLTRDIVDLIGDHLELFRKTQATIGVDVMVTLSSEERDERIKHHLMASKKLHPALLSAESEYKFLQQLVAGLLGLVLRRREVQCPLVRCIAREFVTCLVLQPIMNLVSPEYINQLVELILVHVKDFLTGLDGDDQPSRTDNDQSVSEGSVEAGETAFNGSKNFHNHVTEMPYFGKDEQKKLTLEASAVSSSNISCQESVQPKVADWARVLDAATQRRTEVLAPENLENMWAIGRHYKDKINKATKGHPHLVPPRPGSNQSDVKTRRKDSRIKKKRVSLDVDNESPLKVNFVREGENSSITTADVNKNRLKRSCSTSDINVESEEEGGNVGESQRLLISEDFYSPDVGRRSEKKKINDMSGSVIRAEGSLFPKLMCRVVGAYFEKIGSKSFAVYSIAVTDAQNNKWFVKRRYRNFERLHRQLKDIPNYNLHLPPKRIFSSSTEDAFVHQRCIQLDKYLQDLLSIANVAEQHEVWDFLSASSKNYSFGKSPSVMKTLAAVNVDDAVDDIVRQFKGVSDGFVRKVVGSSSSQYEGLTSGPTRNLSLNERDLNMIGSLDNSIETANTLSDDEEGDKDEIHEHEAADFGVEGNGWHSDNELKSKSFPTRMGKLSGDTRHSYSEMVRPLMMKSDLVGATSLPVHPVDDPVEVPPEWTPPNVTVPILNLVDKVFQLNKRGWIRRQVFWISKQILQLVMEDAIDDWLLMQINWLRREDVVAQGIWWVKDILWPDGKFFLKLEITGGGSDDFDCKSFQATPRAASRKSQSSSFETHLEAARRASYVKKVLFIAYAVLELVLVSVFPELKDVVEDIHYKMQAQR